MNHLKTQTPFILHCSMEHFHNQRPNIFLPQLWYIYVNSQHFVLVLQASPWSFLTSYNSLSSSIINLLFFNLKGQHRRCRSKNGAVPAERYRNSDFKVNLKLAYNYTCLNAVLRSRETCHLEYWCGDGALILSRIHVPILAFLTRGCIIQLLIS